jgi:CBS domain-containing protein
MKALELMTSDPVCCTPDTTAQEAALMMAANDCGCLPVVDDAESRHLVGVVTDRDITLRGVARGLQPRTRVQELMSTELTTAHPEDALEAVEQLMAQVQVRRVPVVDEHGCCVGIIAQADLALDPAVNSELTQVLEQISEPRGRQLA